MEELKRTPFEPTWALIRKPLNYPTSPTEGKIQLIWETNSKSLYRRLSPYSNYTKGIFTWGDQPFYFTYPDEGNKGLPGLRKYESRMFPMGSAPIDVIRVARFLGSGAGLKFLATQFLLQTGNAYNETRIYNPTSPIVAAGMGLTFGMVRPQRNFDTSAGLFGLATTLIGPSIPSLFKEPTINPPSGTTGLSALSDPMKSTGGKGLLRAGTANRGRAHLEAAWPQSGQGGGMRKTFGSVLKNIVTSMFANFIPQTQSGIQFKSDEGAYGLMLGSGPISKFGYLSSKGETLEFGPAWFGGSKIIRKNGQIPQSYKIFVKYDKNGVRSNEIVYSQEGFDNSLVGVGKVGYTSEISTDETRPGMRYGDNVGTKISSRNGEDYTHSDIMRQYVNYVNPNQKFPTKVTDDDVVEQKNRGLRRILLNLNNASNNTYKASIPDVSPILQSGFTTKNNGYDRLYANNIAPQSSNNAAKTFIEEYRSAGVRMVSNELSTDVVENSYKLPTAGWFDAINTLDVLDKHRTIHSSKLTNWKTWEPYKDDLIALYFYDVVNEKYIPFRASIKGLGESGNASWDELQFIGRADKVYSYGGFSRSLTLKIHIVIGSILELAPTWQRINYMTSLLKPANYTKSNYKGAMNRFIVPPMVMLTVGDMYKDQPVLIQSINTSIPDDATWETQTELNTNEWKYLVNYIKAPNAKFGQLPREIDMDFSMYVLEKERAITGGANFGHAPRDESWENWNTETVPNGKSPTAFHENLVVDVPKTGIQYQ